jgi:hypothetical protein
MDETSGRINEKEKRKRKREDKEANRAWLTLVGNLAK